MNKEYKDKVSKGLQTMFGSTPTITAGPVAVHIRVETFGNGLSFKEIMTLRDLFGAEFNMGFEDTGGETSESGTWWPGETFMLFTYMIPEEYR